MKESAIKKGTKMWKRNEKYRKRKKGREKLK